MTELRGFQNKEAERRLKLLGLPDDIVLCSSKGTKRRLGKAELYALKDIEKKYGIVIFHVILTQNNELPDTFDARSEYAFLFVSDIKAKWDEEFEYLRIGTVDAVLENINDGMRIDSISFQKVKAGGYIRIPVVDENEEEG